MSNNKRKRDPDQDIKNLIWLDDKLIESRKKVPKNMNDNEMIEWLRNILNNTTPPRQVGINPKFAADNNAIVTAYIRRIQNVAPTPSSINMTSQKGNTKRKLKFSGGKRRRRKRKSRRKSRRKPERKTKRISKKRHRRRTRRRK